MLIDEGQHLLCNMSPNCSLGMSAPRHAPGFGMPPLIRLQNMLDQRRFFTHSFMTHHAAFHFFGPSLFASVACAMRTINCRHVGRSRCTEYRHLNIAFLSLLHGRGGRRCAGSVTGQRVSDIIPGTKRPGLLSMIFFGIPRAGKRFSPHININVERLQSQTEFTSKEISKEDFEKQWIAATAKR